MPKITCYIDCTETYNTGLNTGIQRVVRNIKNRLDVCTNSDYEFVPVISIGSNIYNYNSTFIFTKYTNTFIGFIRNILDQMFNISDRDIDELGNASLNKYDKGNDVKKLKNKFYAPLLTICRGIIPLFLRVPLYIDSLLCLNKKIEYQRGDIFLIADAFWNINTFSAAKNAKNNNIKTIFIIYDIIPLTYPEYMSCDTRYNFIEFFPKIMSIADGIIAISEYTMTEVKKYCHTHNLPSNLKLDYFHLGADFNTVTNDVVTRTKSTNALNDDNFYLMVGTIEPRKNHLYVLDAFEYLWNNGINIKLYIVGRIGWKSDEILQRITESKYYNVNLYLLDKLDDADLDNCYKKAKAVIVSSHVEGFGLPLIEAMKYNILVLASDIPIFKEVGQEYPLYFSLDDNKTLIDKIYKIENGEILRTEYSCNWLSWDESIRSLFDKVINMAKQI